MGYNEILNEVIDDDKEQFLSWEQKEKALLINQGLKSLSKNQKVVAVDKSHAPVYYLKRFDGTIEKIDATSASNITILTATSGVWANRTTLTYTEGGV